MLVLLGYDWTKATYCMVVMCIQALKLWCLDAGFFAMILLVKSWLLKIIAIFMLSCSKILDYHAYL